MKDAVVVSAKAEHKSTDRRRELKRAAADPCLKSTDKGAVKGEGDLKRQHPRQQSAEMREDKQPCAAAAVVEAG